MSPLENIHTVLIIRCGALGDLIYSTSIMDALQQQYGDKIHIDWVTTPGTGKLFEKDQRVRHTYDLKHRKVPILLSAQKRAIIKASKQTPYDLLINLEQNKYFDNLSNAINATYKIGSPYTIPKLNENTKHMVDIIKAIYAPAVEASILQNAEPRLYGEAFSVLQEKYNLPDKYIAINPSNSHTNSSRINYRAWPLDHWKQLIQKMEQTIPIVILSGKGEASSLETLKPYPKQVIDLAGKTPLKDLIGIIDASQALITTDTGPAHLASATNTPVYALIGPTPLENTGPYQSTTNEVHIITKNLECSPCYKTAVMDACKENICMIQITPNDVITAMQETIEKFNPKHSKIQ